MDADGLVRDYLARLEHEARKITPGEAAGILTEVSEHIELSLAEAGRRDEVVVRTILDRLGPPEAILAVEATRAAPSGQPLAVPQSPWGPIEVIALLLIAAGAVFLPIVGPVLGVILIWVSGRWSVRAKLAATGVAMVVLVIPVLFVFAASTMQPIVSSLPPVPTAP